MLSPPRETRTNSSKHVKCKCFHLQILSYIVEKILVIKYKEFVGICRIITYEKNWEVGKLKKLIIVFIFVIALTGCSESLVEVTIPASEIEEGTLGGIMSGATQEGVSETIVNSDGSVTYKIPKSVHQDMMKEMEVIILEGIEESISEFDSVKGVSHNNSFSEFTLTVDQSKYENSFDGFAVLGVGLMGSYYQMIDGKNTSDQKITIYIKNESDGKLFDTFIFPDDWN